MTGEISSKLNCNFGCIDYHFDLKLLKFSQLTKASFPGYPWFIIFVCGSLLDGSYSQSAHTPQLQLWWEWGLVVVVGMGAGNWDMFIAGLHASSVIRFGYIYEC